MVVSRGPALRPLQHPPQPLGPPETGLLHSRGCFQLRCAPNTLSVALPDTRVDEVTDLDEESEAAEGEEQPEADTSDFLRC